ncbi:MAG: hypothetical protein Q9159_006886 [Coniocarpon cinnabarinum]
MTSTQENAKSEKKKPSLVTFFKRLNHRNTKSKRSKRERQQQLDESENHTDGSFAKNLEKVPVVNQAGRDETEPMQRIPSNGGSETNILPNQPTSSSTVAYKLPQPAATGSFSSIPLPNGDSTERSGNVRALEPSNKSTAPTVETTPDPTQHDMARSKSGTTLPGGGMSAHSAGGSNSVFSSSNHSSRSLTTTLTTIQSQAPSAHLQANPPTAQQASAVNAHGHQHHPSQSSSIYFQHQYPTTPVVSAVPPHLQNPSHLPTTYRSATANNLLSDNASILTLASSSQQAGRRNSLDTAASVRAIAPSSQWGGSRESLPLSMMSQTIDGGSGTNAGQGVGTASSRPSIGGLPSQERASVYSSHGNAPMLSSERNSMYTGRTGTAGGASTHNTINSDNASVKDRGGDEHGSLRADDRSSIRAGDGGSVRSGLGGLGHSRNDSVANSIGGSIGPTNIINSAGGSEHNTGMPNSPVISSTKDMAKETD